MAKHHWNVYKPYLKNWIEGQPLDPELFDGLAKEACFKVPKILKLHFVLSENGFSDDEVDSIIRTKFNISATHLGMLAGFLLGAFPAGAIDKNPSEPVKTLPSKYEGSA